MKRASQRDFDRPHSCPICATELRANARYPRYICPDCASKAADADGRRLLFYNEDFSGGLKASYADNDEPYERHECFIEGVKCWADEARFGGIVIQTVEE